MFVLGLRQYTPTEYIALQSVEPWPPPLGVLVSVVHQRKSGTSLFCIPF